MPLPPLCKPLLPARCTICTLQIYYVLNIFNVQLIFINGQKAFLPTGATTHLLTHTQRLHIKTAIEQNSVFTQINGH